MSKKIVFLISLLFASFLLSSMVFADLIPPEFLEEKCRPGEKQITCSYKSNGPFGPKTEDNCEKYANDQNYYYLTERSYGTGLGGEQKYCLREKSAMDNFNIPKELGADTNYSNETILVTVIAILSLFGISLIRKKKNAGK